MVVEDDPSLRQVLEIFLQQMGCEVLSEANGQRALELVGNLPTPPDLILTDLSLPGLDGFALLAAVRASHPKLPVILLTGFRGDALRPNAPQPDAILEKPIQLSDLKKAVSDFLASGK